MYNCAFCDKPINLKGSKKCVTCKHCGTTQEVEAVIHPLKYSLSDFDCKGSYLYSDKPKRSDTYENAY